MRIISGKFKGKSINFLKNLNTRHLKDSVKENIFNIIKHSKLIPVKIEKANILDLYSGVGSFGLECISRGANNVTFIEENIEAINKLKDNVIKLSVINQTTLLNKKIENISFLDDEEKYDILFFDPPYADKKFVQNLFSLKKSKIFKKKHLIIIHRERNSEDNYENIIDLIILKKYGRSKIIFGSFI